ncbi:MAG: histidine phosphatase family protein [Alphaproteobacteria bacterium]|nr:histidine phosphatase family protein [Alphaproteobacteria bacterium]
MARLYLIRHGEPSGTWGQSADPDPGLTELGRSQAESAGERLAKTPPKLIVSSPLRRARETAIPLARTMNVDPKIAEAVAEIPTPASIPFAQRGDWLRNLMMGEWSAADASLQTWRDGVVAYLASLQDDTAVFSHFVAINVALGAAIGDDRVVCFKPAHASITVLETKRCAIALVELGETADTAVR